MDELEAILWKTRQTTDYSYRKKSSHLLNNTTNQVSHAKHASSFDELVLPSASMVTLKHRETKQGLHRHSDGNYGNKLKRHHGDGMCILSGRHYGDHGNEKLGVNRYLSNHNYGNYGYSRLEDTCYRYSNKFHDNHVYEKLDNIKKYGNFRPNCYGNVIDNLEHHSNRYYGSIMDNQKYHSDKFNPMPISVKGQRVRSNEKEMVVKYRLEKERDKDKKKSMNEQTAFRTKSRRRKVLASRELNERLIKKGVSLPSPPLVANYTPKEEREGRTFRPSVIHESYKSLKEFEESRCCRVDDRKPTRQEANDERTKRYVHVYLCCCKDG